MFSFTSLASGSSGNCAVLETDSDIILIDAGIPRKRLDAYLHTPERKEKRLSLFITHEHTDHVSGFGRIMQKYRPAVYSSEKVAAHLVDMGADAEDIFVLDSDVCYDMGDFAVTPFRTTHDSVQPLCYRFDSAGGCLACATDLGVVTDYMLNHLAHADVLMLESNYEPSMLEAGKYPHFLKKRIASPKGHLSNQDAVKAIGDLAGGKLATVLLAHVSKQNNTYELVREYATYCTRTFGVDVRVLTQAEQSDAIVR